MHLRFFCLESATFGKKLPHRGFVTKSHIDFSLEISGNCQAVRRESDGCGSVRQ
ncbi:MAG: hypothetical protein J6W00_00265 [Lentisphaeria bacterium]|nr:hypothetical protein [Lentisphaeria bacterium]